MDRTVDRLRKAAYAALREFEATAFVVCPPDVDARKRLDKQREVISTATKKELLRITEHLNEGLKEIRRQYGVKAPSSVLLKIHQWLEQAPADSSVVLPLYFLRSLFHDDMLPIPGMDAWPSHARVALDASGTLYDKSRHPEVYLLEAIIYEDMASLFNLAKREDDALGNDTLDKIAIKTRNALCRATTAAAVYFVEAYLNGLAVDYLVSSPKPLDETTRSVLLDWDHHRNRPRYLSLRDKILQYQRIVLGVEHAPLQENNCPEIAQILRTAKVARDAVAHPSPAFDVKTFNAEKERAILELRIAAVEEAVDTVVSFVSKLEEAVHGSRRRLFWLHPRGADGLFPPAAFA